MLEKVLSKIFNIDQGFFIFERVKVPSIDYITRYISAILIGAF